MDGFRGVSYRDDALLSVYGNALNHYIYTGVIVIALEKGEE